MEINDTLQNLEIFKDLEKESYRKILSIGSYKKYPEGEKIFTEEENGVSFFIIIEGKVKVFKTNQNGEEVVLEVISELGYWNEIEVITEEKITANVSALTDSQLFVINQNNLYQLLRNEPDVAIHLLKMLSKKIRGVEKKIKTLSIKDTESKIADFLLQLANENGVVRKGTMEIKKLPSLQEFAEISNISKETILRTLQSLAKKELIEIEGETIRIINYEKFKGIYG